MPIFLALKVVASLSLLAFLVRPLIMSNTSTPAVLDTSTPVAPSVPANTTGDGAAAVAASGTGKGPARPTSLPVGAKAKSVTVKAPTEVPIYRYVCDASFFGEAFQRLTEGAWNPDLEDVMKDSNSWVNAAHFDFLSEMIKVAIVMRIERKMLPVQM